MKNKGIGTVVIVVVILAIGGVGAYSLTRSSGEGNVTENEFLNNVQNFANQMEASAGSGVTKIRIPENSMLKFENQSAIAITGVKTHSYNTNRELVIEPELETGIGPGEHKLSYTQLTHLKNGGMKVMALGKK